MSYDKTLRLWDLKTKKELVKLEHTSYVTSIVFSPGGDTLASGGGDNIVRLWDLKTKKELVRLEGHTERVESIAFGQGGMLASGSYDKTVRLWDLKAKKELARLEGHTNIVTSIAFGPGDTLASGGGNNTVLLWDLKAKKELARLEGHTSLVYSIAFGPGHTLASGSGDKTIRLWDLKTKKELARLEGHTQYVKSIAFGPGDILASGSDDQTVRLWDVKNCHCLGQLTLTQGISAVTWKKIGNENILGVAFGKEIACFQVQATTSGYTFKLKMLARSSAILFCNNLDLTNASGLETDNLTVLKQRGAKGESAVILPNAANPAGFFTSPLSSTVVSAASHQLPQSITTPPQPKTKQLTQPGTLFITPRIVPVSAAVMNATSDVLPVTEETSEKCCSIL